MQNPQGKRKHIHSARCESQWRYFNIRLVGTGFSEFISFFFTHWEDINLSVQTNGVCQFLS